MRGFTRECAMFTQKGLKRYAAKVGGCLCVSAEPHCTSGNGDGQLIGKHCAIEEREFTKW